MPQIAPIPKGLLNRISAAGSLTLLTGSGISAASGVPTFRDAQSGIWAKYRPEELATPEAFAIDPHRVWRWYRWRREIVAKALPNAAHFACTRMLKRFPGSVLVTQNVDGLHQAANSADVIELHGNIFRERCANGHVTSNPGNGLQGIPACDSCGESLRPDVVWFGEPLPHAALAAADLAARHCDVFISIGTSAVVYPANTYATLAKACGAAIVEINTTNTPLTPQADFVLRGPADQVLPELVAQLPA